MDQQASRVSRAQWVAVVAVVALIAIAAAGYWHYQVRETSREIGPGARMTEAPAGRVVSEFPKELILDANARITESYRIDYADGNAAQPVASYLSDQDVRANILAFRTYFTDNDWTIVEEGNSAEVPATSVRALKDDAQVNVTLQVLPEGKTQVTIAHFSKK